MNNVLKKKDFCQVKCGSEFHWVLGIGMAMTNETGKAAVQ